MLKAQVDNELWMVQQHHHAQVSGYLAAHWGGSDGFVRPGHYPGATAPSHWREEVVLGIAEHDNGWWEEEAMPHIASDGLPVGIGKAAAPTEDNGVAAWRSGGFDRWRKGIQRLAGPHPYGALLISLHAYWLYAINFPDLVPAISDTYRHFVFGQPHIASGLVRDEVETRAFLHEQVQLQDELKSKLAQDAVMVRAIESEHLAPHLRLLQLFDSMSLYLGLNDMREQKLIEIPRSSWTDRCEITWSRPNERTIRLDPYPFEVEQLEVPMPTRILPVQRSSSALNEDQPLTTLHATPLETVYFTLTR